MEFKIGNKKIGKNYPVFIIAELSGNHNQSYEKALKIIDAAKDAGVNAVKSQTYTPDTITLNCDNKYFQVKVNDAWRGQTLYNLYQKAYTPWDWQAKLKKYAEKKGLLFFSTPFDNTAVDFLEKLNVELYKVASFEIVDIPLLKKIGQTKKSVIMSRGMASISEIKLAIKTLKENGCPQIAILHCVSAYPAKPEEMNLATIPDIAKKFKVISGLSDHTLGIETAIAGVSLGANIIEKHLTLNRAEGGPDAAFSLEPQEFKNLVTAIRNTEKAIGKSNYQAQEAESENIIFRKSLFVIKGIKKGEKLNTDNTRSIRPGYGLVPKYYNEILGKKAVCNLKFGTPLDWSAIILPKIRLAQKKDAQAIWEIRNQPLARQSSNNQKIITLENHQQWFDQQYFKTKNNLCFVLISKAKIMGYCRFDLKKDHYLISIALAEQFLAQGWGDFFLKKILKQVRLNKTLIAEIQKNNIASFNLFLKNNFQVYKEDNLKYLLRYDKA